MPARGNCGQHANRLQGAAAPGRRWRWRRRASGKLLCFGAGRALPDCRRTGAGNGRKGPARPMGTRLAAGWRTAGGGRHQRSGKNCSEGDRWRVTTKVAAPPPTATHYGATNAARGAGYAKWGLGARPQRGVWGRAPPAGVWGLAPIRRTRRDFVNARGRDVADYIPLRTSHESRAPRPLPQPQPEPDPITRMFQRGTAGSPKHDPSTANYLPKARREGFWLRGFQGALFQVAPKF